MHQDEMAENVEKKQTCETAIAGTDAAENKRLAKIDSIKAAKSKAESEKGEAEDAMDKADKEKKKAEADVSFVWNRIFEVYAHFEFLQLVFRFYGSRSKQETQYFVSQPTGNLMITHYSDQRGPDGVGNSSRRAGEGDRRAAGVHFADRRRHEVPDRERPQWAVQERECDLGDGFRRGESGAG